MSASMISLSSASTKKLRPSREFSSYTVERPALSERRCWAFVIYRLVGDYISPPTEALSSAPLLYAVRLRQGCMLGRGRARA